MRQADLDAPVVSGAEPLGRRRKILRIGNDQVRRLAFAHHLVVLYAQGVAELAAQRAGALVESGVIDQVAIGVCEARVGE